MSRRPGRTGLLIALWVAAAVGALVLGLYAVGSALGGAGSTEPLSAGEIDARLAAPPPPSAPPPPPATRPAPGPSERPTVVPAGPAGTVLARCVGGAPSVVSVNPAQGFEASDDNAGSRVKLEGDDVDVTVALRCDGARPVGSVAVQGDDDD